MAKRTLVDRLRLVAAKGIASRAYRQFRAAVARGTAVQREVLLAKVRRHAESDYGREHGFDGIRSYDDFRRHVPIQRYEELAPYIERLKRGELSALLGPGEKLHMFALTSGTTDKPKFIPVTDAFLAEYRRGWNAFGVKALIDHHGSFLRSIVQVTSPMDEFHTDAGTPCGAISGLMSATQQRLVRRYYVAPFCVARIDDATARYYTIMRLAVPQDVSFLVTASPATILKLVRTADEMRETLIRDVHDGTLDADLVIPAAVRDELQRRLRPQPEAARRLGALAERHDALLPKHYWDLGFVANWLGGTMGLYRQEYGPYFGETPVRDIGLLASEGRVSIPISDETPAGILEVNSHFYEFIPAREYGSANPVTLRSHEVEPGQDYFLLLTTSSGLYRYDIGDQVRVVGWAEQAPMIEFVNRGAHVCSLAGEKLTERQCVLAVERAAGRLGRTPVQFVVAPRWGDPPYYVVHVERQAVAASAAVDFAADLDQALGDLNIEYQSKRKTDRLGPVRVNRLPEGFLQTRDEAEAARGRREQFKHRYLFTDVGADAAFPGSASATAAARVQRVEVRG